MFNLVIDQIALCPPDPERAIKFLKDLGLTDWVHDTVTAEGTVFGKSGSNTADLAFNYQAMAEGSVELEILHYKEGPNWMEKHGPSVSHIGVHVTQRELDEIRRVMGYLKIELAQAVNTTSHTNPYLLDKKRKFLYEIYDTRDILGVDLKFIVRKHGQ